MKGTALVESFRTLHVQLHPCNPLLCRVLQDEWCPDGKEKKPSPYKDGFFKLSFTIPADYPTSCPTVKVDTKLYHTHVDEEKNELCADTMPEIWKEKDSKDRRIFHLLEGFRRLLASPEGGTSAVNSAASSLLQTSVDEYYKKAREWTEKYAMEADEDDDGDDDDDDEDDDE